MIHKLCLIGTRRRNVQCLLSCRRIMNWMIQAISVKSCRSMADDLRALIKRRLYSFCKYTTSKCTPILRWFCYYFGIVVVSASVGLLVRWSVSRIVRNDFCEFWKELVLDKKRYFCEHYEIDHYRQAFQLLWCCLSGNSWKMRLSLPEVCTLWVLSSYVVGIVDVGKRRLSMCRRCKNMTTPENRLTVM